MTGKRAMTRALFTPGCRPFLPAEGRGPVIAAPGLPQHAVTGRSTHPVSIGEGWHTTNI